MPYLAIDRATATVIPDSPLGAPLTSEGWTLLDFRTELRSALGNRTDVVDDRLDLWINTAYIDLATSLNLPTLKGSLQFDLVGDQPFYILPPQVFAVEGVSVEKTGQVWPEHGGRPLEGTTHADWRTLPGLTDDVVTKFFTHGRDVLVIYPTPLIVLPVNIEFWIRPDYMTLDVHSPIIPVEWHENIFLSARAKGHRILMEQGSANEAENDLAVAVRKREDPKSVEAARNKPSGLVPIGYKSQRIKTLDTERDW